MRLGASPLPIMMIRINLLPHREIRRAAQQRELLIVAGFFVGLAIAIVVSVHGVNEGLIKNQMSRNNFLESQIAELDKQIEEIKKLKEQTQALLARKQVVESLQGNRTEVVHLLDQLVRHIPEGVYLKAVKQTGMKVTVTGFAQSNARVSTLMRNLESSPWLESPNLIEIKASVQENSRLSEFALTVTVSREASEAAPSTKGKTV
jgi:type IV pilus assembly protein PilN